ncbi:N-lysine methyltransferase KMT5A-A-like isoform X1 [Embiotoca jacksoni]|uniref:N-lysine methyltransferase KMT5A-A-like isoform X1 n=1 Tax=Embiotoca jacksoni TaxID=100190 RepID=UPI00370452FD
MSRQSRTVTFEMTMNISPLKDAMKHVRSKTDKTLKLEVKYINAVKGRGIFALRPFCKGEFVVEYRGDMISDAESQRRRKVYHPACTAFFLPFKWRGKKWCIDASRDDGSFGRLVNDEHRHPNCRMKRIAVDGKKHLCLFAIKDIKEGEDITYAYKGEDYPWRIRVSPVKVSCPAVLSETTHPQTTEQQWSMLQLCSEPCNCFLNPALGQQGSWVQPSRLLPISFSFLPTTMNTCTTEPGLFTLF